MLEKIKQNRKFDIEHHPYSLKAFPLKGTTTPLVFVLKNRFASYFIVISPKAFNMQGTRKKQNFIILRRYSQFWGLGKKGPKFDQKCRNFCRKLKFKIELMARNEVWSAKKYAQVLNKNFTIEMFFFRM